MSLTRLPKIYEVLCLCIFIIGLIFLGVHVLQLPIQLSLLSSWFVVIALGKFLGLGYDAMQKGINQGISKGMTN